MRTGVAIFLALTFGITWVLCGGLLLAVPGLAESSWRTPLFFLAVYAPAIAAIATAAVCGGEAWRRFVQRVFERRIAWLWFAGVPAAFLLLQAASTALALAMGEGGVAWPFAFAAALALSPLADPGPVEEVGWRGWLTPVLQERFAPLTAALIVGVIWGLWHLPVIVMPGFPQHDASVPLWLAIARFVAQTAALSVIMTVVLNRTKGSVPVAALGHWAVNLAWALGLVSQSATAWAMVTVLAAAALGVVFRHDLGAAGPRVRAGLELRPASGVATK